jgi:Subtilase family
MKRAPLLVFLPLLFPVCVLAARPLVKPEVRADGRYEFRDGRAIGKWRIANDELEQIGEGNSKRVPMTAKDHLSKVQQEAKNRRNGGKRFDLVAYREDRPQTDANRRTVTNKVGVSLEEGMDPTAIGLAAKATAMKAVIYDPGSYVMTFPDALEAIAAAEALRAVPGVRTADVLLGEKRTPALVPTDPLFTLSPIPYAYSIGEDYADIKTVFNPIPVILFPQQTRAYQWYLNKTASLPQLPIFYSTARTTPIFSAGTYEERDLPPWVEPNLSKRYGRYFEQAIDLNVISAWDNLAPDGLPVDGSGVKIGIMDDGVQLDHPELSGVAKILSRDDYNFIEGYAGTSALEMQKRENPTPFFVTGAGAPSHGTSTTALILAKRDGKGMTGVAPDASYAAYRIIGSYIDAKDFADALVWKSETVPRISPTNSFGLDLSSDWRRGAANIKFAVSHNGYQQSTRGADLLTLNRYVKRAFAFGATLGRIVDDVPRGIIYVVAAGNDGAFHGNTNCSELSNSRYVLTVGAVSDLGRRIAYSTPGASLHVVAPSAGAEMAPRIVLPTNTPKPALPTLTPVDNSVRSPTVMPTRPNDLIARALGWTTSPDDWDNPDSVLRTTQQVITATTAAVKDPTPIQLNVYNPNFEGTSASSALATGVIALMLEVNPGLGYRDVQEILMRSASVVDPMMGEWQYNSLGMPMSHKYGAGLIDADHAVRMARVWQNLDIPIGGLDFDFRGFEYNEYKGVTVTVGGGGRRIPDNRTQPLIINVPGPGEMRVERIVVRLKIEHGRRGDLGVILSAPRSGQADADVESYLLLPRREDVNQNLGDPSVGLGETPLPDDPPEFTEFTTVQHWGTSPANQQLDPLNPGSNGDWTLTIWDNTTKGTQLSPNLTSANQEDRIYVAVPNPGTQGLFKEGTITYHGTASSNNETPVINASRFVGRINNFFRGNSRATSDTSDFAFSNVRGPRAPITNYRLRVLNTNGAGPTMVIAPSTYTEYRAEYGNLATNPAYLRFDRSTGTLVNTPYPDAPASFPPFKPLVVGNWQIELRATNVFGTTRKQIPLVIKLKITYDEWKNIYFLPEQLADVKITGQNADPDGDGVTNLMEFALGGNPLVAEPGLKPTFTFIGNNLVIDYRTDTAIEGHFIRAEVSSMLSPESSWTAAPSVVTSTVGTVQIRKATIPIVPGTRLFARIRVAPGAPTN